MDRIAEAVSCIGRVDPWCSSKERSSRVQNGTSCGDKRHTKVFPTWCRYSWVQHSKNACAGKNARLHVWIRNWHELLRWTGRGIAQTICESTWNENTAAGGWVCKSDGRTVLQHYGNCKSDAVCGHSIDKGKGTGGAKWTIYQKYEWNSLFSGRRIHRPYTSYEWNDQSQVYEEKQAYREAWFG